MNKNLKRALNTTAAVSMSLAMVLGAVSPVSAKLNDEKTDIEDVRLTQNQFNSVSKFVKAFIDAIDDVKTITGNSQLKPDLVVMDGKEIVGGYNLTGTEFEATIALATGSDISNGITGNTVKEVLIAYVDNFNALAADKEDDQSYYDAAAHLVGTTGKHQTIFEGAAKVVDFVNKTVKDDLNADGEVDVKAYDADEYDAASKIAKYVGNVEDKTIRNLFNEWYSQMGEWKEDSDAENEDKYLEDYIEALEEKAVYNGGPTVRELVEKDEEIHYSNRSKLERFIKNVENDKAGLPADLEYEDIKDEAEVAELIEGLKAIVDEMKEVEELLDSTNAVYKNYKKVADKVAAIISAMNTKKYEVKTKATVKVEYTDVEIQENIEKALSGFRTSDVEKLKAYVEEVFNEFYTVSPRETSRGTYVLRLEKAEYGRYVTEEAKDTFDAKLVELLTTPVDKTESEESYYDVLVSKNATVDELLKAVTEDIEGLTFNTTMTNADAVKIIAARKAYKELEARDFAGLTYKEKKAAEANEELIEVLYKKLLYTGVVVTVGWVETPQGWEYYDNNGKRVYEGWAPGNGYWSYMKNGYAAINDWCAAKEGWYYMGADGKMVTGKVVIDGVEYDFGTDGIWVR